MHNFEQGVKHLSTTRLQNHYTLIGRRSNNRSAHNPQFRSRSGFDRALEQAKSGARLARDHAFTQRAGAAARKADITVVHGFQNQVTIRNLRRRSKILIYMPHSPVPMHQEVADAATLAGNPLSADVVSRIFRTERQTMRVADRIVFPSPGATTTYEPVLENANASSKIDYIASGVSLPGNLSHTQKFVTPTFVFAGRYVEHKGIDLYVEAARLVKLQASNVDFLSLGVGPVDVSWPVRDLGWKEQPHDVIKKCQCIIVPNRHAYFDLLPLEAAALGVSIVFTPVGGNVDQARSLPDSILAEEVSPRAVADAMLKVLGRPTSFGLRNQGVAENMFSAVAMAQRWDDYFTAWLS